MLAVARILAVLVATVAFTAVLLMVVAVLDVRRLDLDLDRADAGSELFSALTRAGVEPGDLETSDASVCGFPPRASTYRLSHDDVVVLAGCLREEGYLTPTGLRRVEESSLEITGRETSSSVDVAFVSSDGEVVERPWWESALMLATWVSGIGLITWLVGFRLPLLRPARRS